MALWCKFEKYQVTEMRDGCVYKTRKIETKYFRMGQSPETSTYDSNGIMWCACSDMPVTSDNEPLGE